MSMITDDCPYLKLNRFGIGFTYDYEYRTCDLFGDDDEDPYVCCQFDYEDKEPKYNMTKLPLAVNARKNCKARKMANTLKNIVADQLHIYYS